MVHLERRYLMVASGLLRATTDEAWERLLTEMGALEDMALRHDSRLLDGMIAIRKSYVRRSIVEQVIIKHFIVRPIDPPQSAQYVLHLLLPLETQDGIVGDLAERYPKRVREYGQRRARWWYRKQAAGLALYAVWEHCRGLVKWGAGLELVRRLLGG